MSGRAWRFPALFIIPALITAGVVVQDSRTNATEETSVVQINEMIAVASPSDALSTTWYCPAGTATGDANGFAEQTVIVANANDVDSNGVITVIPEQGVPVTKNISVPAHGRTQVRVSDVAKSPWASALVEVSGGMVTVNHELRGPAGRSMSACASSPSTTWYFPAGTSIAGSRSVLALFNPFPGEATVDISFDTEDGARTPQQLQGMVVPGGRVTIVEVSQIVTLRERVALTVSARIGRIVAEQVLSVDGRGGADHGLTSVLGATIAAPVWTFPVATPAAVDANERIAVFNPGDTDSDVEVQVLLDDPSVNGTVEPFEVSVPAHRSTEINLVSDARIPASVGRWLVVRTIDGSSVVAERWIGSPRSAASGGLTLTMGIPVVATTWLGPLGTGPDLSMSQLVIANPSASDTATISMRLHSKGRAIDVGSVSNFRLLPGQRTVINMASLLVGRLDSSYVIESDFPVVVGQWMQSSSSLDFITLSPFPLRGTLTMPMNVITSSSISEIDLSQIPEDNSVTSSTSTPVDGSMATTSSTSSLGSSTTTVSAAPN